MKQTFLFAALGVVALGASAQDVGRVISRTPVVQQVAVPRQVCSNQFVRTPTTGGGAALGGLTGAAIGSGIGQGSGNAAAIAVGAILGGIIGNNVEARNNTMVVPNCVTENTYENRTVAWDVTYDYQGQQYQVQMPYDPGPTVRLNVAGAGAATQQQAPYDGLVVTAPPVEQQPRIPQAQVAQGQPYAVQPQAQVIQQQPQVVQQQPQVIAQPQVVQTMPGQVVVGQPAP